MNTDKLRDAFVTSLELAPSVDVTTLKYREIPEWDSIGHMALVASIEDAFDVMLTTDQVIALSSFDAAIDILKDQGVDGS